MKKRSLMLNGRRWYNRGLRQGWYCYVELPKAKAERLWKAYCDMLLGKEDSEGELGLFRTLCADHCIIFDGEVKKVVATATSEGLVKLRFDVTSVRLAKKGK